MASHIADGLLAQLVDVLEALPAHALRYNMPVRALFAYPATSYRADAYVAAAAALDIELVLATDLPAAARRHGLEHHRVDFAAPERSVAELRTALQPVDGVIAADERSALLAAAVAAESALCGGRYHSVAGVEAACDKRQMRSRLRAAAVSVPDYFDLPVDGTAPTGLPFPCVVKPTMLSGSQGVIRVDDEASLPAAVSRVCRILDRHGSPLRVHRRFFALLGERYVDGAEVAVEALMRDGEMLLIAIFDKPDALCGPYFEETIYVTPSRHPAALQKRLCAVTHAAARALGLSDGPVHAELRVGPDGEPVVIEVAARSIGGLCSRALGHVVGSLEQMLLCAAVGRELPAFPKPCASGVMMMPVPNSGVLQRVSGLEEARAVAGIDAVEVSVKVGEGVRALPEGDRYLGFIFAHGARPEQVEVSLREAHGALDFALKPLLALA
jgi:biotin carboxylase